MVSRHRIRTRASYPFWRIMLRILLLTVLIADGFDPRKVLDEQCNRECDDSHRKRLVKCFEKFGESLKKRPDFHRCSTTTELKYAKCSLKCKLLKPHCELTRVCTPKENPKRPIGDTCGRNSDCEDGMNIKDGTGSVVCNTDGVCQETAIMDGLKCSRNEQCFRHACYKKKCISKAKAGSKCSRNSHCASGVCVKRSCQKDYVKRGGACDDDHDCNPNSKLVCIRDSKKCGVGTRAAGKACRANKDCFSDVCVERRCKSDPQEVGERCDDNGDCFSGLCWKKVCRDLRAVKRSCKKNADCKSGVCVKKRCVAKKVDENGKCDDNDDCASNVCVNKSCRSGKVVGGKECDDDEDCESGVCYPEYICTGGINTE